MPPTAGVQCFKKVKGGGGGGVTRGSDFSWGKGTKMGGRGNG